MSKPVDQSDQFESARDLDMKMQIQATHSSKEKKMKLLTALAAEQSSNHAFIQANNEKKVNYVQKVDDNRKIIEELQKGMMALTQKAELSEKKQRQLEQRTDDLQTQLINEVARTAQMVADADAKAVASDKLLEQACNDLGNEMRNLLNQKEKKINLNIDAKVNDEAHSRHQVENDLAKLTEAMKELRGNLESECGKILAKIEANQVKHNGDFMDLSNLLNAERATHDRGIVTAKNDAKAINAELKAFLDAKCKEITKEQKSASNQLTFMLDSLNTEIKRNASERNEMIDTARSDLMARCDFMANEAKNDKKQLSAQADDIFDQAKNLISTVKNDLDAEVTNRLSAEKALDDKLQQEHLIREQDEEKIIDMMDAFMKQVKSMNHH